MTIETSMVASREVLMRLFGRAVAEVQPERCLLSHLPPPPRGRTVVVGAGKAAAAMARTVETRLGGEIEGLVVTRHGYAVPTERIAVVEASHPLPDQAGQKAAARMLEMVSGLGPDDFVLCLLSGGGSALLALPAPGLRLGDKRATTDSLLRCGATISEINAVRKQLSAIKGGRLAAATAPAPILTLMISDVPGDDPAVIASGPTVAHPPSPVSAEEVLAKYAITPPAAVARQLRAGADKALGPGDPRLAHARYVIVASANEALAAATEEARVAGYSPLMLGDDIEGESREVARAHAALALDHAARGCKTALLSGGETTVTLTGGGRGGPNAEYALALCLALDGAPSIAALACDTDGIDGSEDNAGAVVASDSLARMRRAGIDAKARLADNDAYGAFAAIGDLVITGPTHTNVNDFRAILVG